MSARPTGCTELARIDLSEREALVDQFGESAMESVLAASQPGRLLWSDELAVAFLARERFGVRRIWTQSIARRLSATGAFSLERYAEISAKLAGYCYTFAGLSSESVAYAARVSGWSPHQWPLANILSWYLPHSTVGGDSAAVFAAGLIVDAYRNILLADLRQALVLASLDSLSSREDGQRTVAKFEMLVQRFFGLNVVGARDVREIVGRWRLARPFRGAILPK